MKSDNLIMLCAVLTIMVAIAVPFVRRAAKYRKAVGTDVPEEETTVEEQPEQPTPEEIYLLRYISPDRGPMGSKQTLRIRTEYYDLIRAITHTIGEHGISQTAYLDNVLKAHFEDNRDVINTLYRSSADRIFKSDE